MHSTSRHDAVGRRLAAIVLVICAVWGMNGLGEAGESGGTTDAGIELALALPLATESQKRVHEAVQWSIGPGNGMGEELGR